MVRKTVFIGCIIFLFPFCVYAGHQVCGKQTVSDRVRQCPDGSIPLYMADEIKLMTPATAKPQKSIDDTQVTNNAPDLKTYFGVWRTNIPGAVWTSPSGYQGYEWLHVSAGVATGDLIIKPDGTYVWNSYGGKSGKWIRGDAEYPIVLVDTVENRRWKVGADRKHTAEGRIYIWDGKSYYYSGRR